VLLEKKGRLVDPVKAHYVGFEIPDLFVVGYGLDYAERYRHLPFVGVLHPQLLDGAEVVETERGSARNGPAARHSAGRTARRV